LLEYAMPGFHLSSHGGTPCPFYFRKPDCYTYLSMLQSAIGFFNGYWN